MLPNLPDIQEFMKEIAKNASIPLSIGCRSKVSLFQKGLEERSLEAMTILSSYSNGQPGFFTDRISDFGHYRQCLYSKFNGSNTRYFLIQVTHPGHEVHPKPWHKRDQFVDVVHPSNFRPAPILHAICLPSECSRQDVEGLLKDDVVKSKIFPLELNIFTSESFDDTDPFEEYRLSRLVAKTIIYFLVILTLIASLTSRLLPANSILQAWNAVENHKRIFSDMTLFSDERLYIFNFYKTMFTMIGLFSHVVVCFTTKAAPFVHSIIGVTLPHKAVKPDPAGLLSVNINFVFSAALAVINVVPMMPKLSFTLFVVGRALRTMPVLIMVTLIFIAFPFFDDNPFGRGALYLEMHKNITANCVTNGWRDVLFMTTSLQWTNICNQPSWFITVDFRMYVLSFLVFVFLAKSPKIGLSLLATQTVVGIVIHYWSLKVNNVFPPIPFQFDRDDNMADTWSNALVDTRGHIASYCVGMALGYIILKTEKWKSVSITHVILSFMAIFACLYAFVSVYDPRSQQSSLTDEQQLIFASTIRLFYLSSVAWAFHALGFSSDVMISFSKKKIFAIVSRFSFSVFMIHSLFVSYFQSTLTQIPEYSHLYIFCIFLFVSFVSFPSAYLIMILVEYPFGNLLKRVLKNKKKQQ